MMKRIYFLSPDLRTTHQIVDDLLLARIEERHIHVLAKRETPLGDLHEASLMQKSDFVPAVQRGLTLEGTVGLLAGLVAIALPGANLVIAGGSVLGSSLAAAGLGAWLGTRRAPGLMVRSP